MHVLSKKTNTEENQERRNMTSITLIECGRLKDSKKEKVTEHEYKTL